MPGSSSRSSAAPRNSRAAALSPGTGGIRSHRSQAAMSNAYQTTTLGYPRVGPGRAYKWMLEEYWSGKTDEATLQEQARQREAECLMSQQEAGIALIACGYLVDKSRWCS